VAAVILFTCLSAAALSYNTAVNLSNKLNATVLINRAVPEIRNNLKDRLFNGEMEGQAVFSERLKFTWKAVKQRAGRTIFQAADPYTGAPNYGRFQVVLYSVDLEISLARKDSSHRARYEYTELLWHESESP